MEPVAAGRACSWCYSQGIDKPALDLSLFIKATAMGWVVPRTLVILNLGLWNILVRPGTHKDNDCERFR